MAADMDKKYGQRRRSGLRARKAPRASELLKEPQSSAHRTRFKEPEEQTEDHVLHAMLRTKLSGLQGFNDLEFVALTQYNLKKGLERFGQPAADTVYKEMKQLHDRKTIRPCYVYKLTKLEKRKALAYLMFIKEKRCGTIKGRGCADGRKQRLYKTKAETSSPTVRTESLLLSCVIDVKERRQVITADIPGAFMQVDIDEVVHVRLDGALVELLTKVDPKLYTKFVCTERGKPVIYVVLEKAVYGTLSASLLFWEDLKGHLQEEGYEANPYDSCVVNKQVHGKQSTVL